MVVLDENGRMRSQVAHLRGICPNCNYVWEITACFSCKQYSLHVEWYHFPEDPQTENEEESVDLEITVTR